MKYIFKEKCSVMLGCLQNYVHVHKAIFMMQYYCCQINIACILTPGEYDF